MNTVYDFLLDLYDRGLVKHYENGAHWIRNIINLQDEQTHGFINLRLKIKNEI